MIHEAGGTGSPNKMNAHNFRPQYQYFIDDARWIKRSANMNDLPNPHELELSPSHRRAMRARIATALIAAFLVVVGLAGLSEVASQATASVFDAPAAQR